MGDEYKNQKAKSLVLADGMTRVTSGTVGVTEKRHLAVRNAIMSHRHGDREPLEVSKDD